MVKKKSYKVIWSDIAKGQLKEAYKHIKKDSEKNAKTVRTRILESTRNYLQGRKYIKQTS